MRNFCIFLVFDVHLTFSIGHLVRFLYLLLLAHLWHPEYLEQLRIMDFEYISSEKV